MQRPMALGEVLARLGGLAGLYRVDLEPVYRPLSTLGRELAESTRVTVPHTFDRIAIATRATHAHVSAFADPDQLRQLALLASATEVIDLELETSADAFALTVQAPQASSWATLREQLEGLGAPPGALEVAVRAGERLGETPYAISVCRRPNRAARWILELRHSNGSDAERGTTRSRLLDAAEQLAITAAQRSIIEGLHDVLAKDADSEARLAIDADQAMPTFSVRWHHVRWATVIRMMLGFYPKLDAAHRLGELAGAFDAEQAAAMELELGPTEPPATRITVTS